MIFGEVTGKMKILHGFYNCRLLNFTRKDYHNKCRDERGKMKILLYGKELRQ